MEVRLEDVCGRPAPLGQDLLDAVDVALRVNDDRAATPAHYVTTVTQVRGVNGDDLDVAHALLPSTR